jgi:glucan phosphoethanolaminetransferase (alkaline phosphatase superfamily)
MSSSVYFVNGSRLRDQFLSTVQEKIGAASREKVIYRMIKYFSDHPERIGELTHTTERF